MATNQPHKELKTMARDAIAIAQKLMRKYHTSDPQILAGILGVEIIELSDLTRQRGIFKVIVGNAFIFINANLSEQLKKMIIAHELGHVLLHWDEGKKPSGLVEFEIFDIKDQKEYDANLFAATLLIDDEELRNYIYVERLDVVSIARIMNINVNLLLLKLNEMNNKGAGFNLPPMPKRNFIGTMDDNAGEL